MPTALAAATMKLAPGPRPAPAAPAADGTTPKKAGGPFEYVGYLDGLRAVAALFVVLHHVLLQVTRKAPMPHSIDRFFEPLLHGHEAVDLFIVLSGFCLMLPVCRNGGRMRQSPWLFFWQRARRILPPYYFAGLFTLGLIALCLHDKTGTLWDSSLPVTARSLWSHLLLVQDAVGEDHTINYVFWSIAVEWRIYFLFPLLVLGWRFAGPLAVTALAVVASYVAYRLGNAWFGVTLSVHYVGLFAMGMLGASISHALSGGSLSALRSRVPWGWIAAAVVALSLSFDHVALYRGHVPSQAVADIIVGVGAMSLLILATIHEDHWVRAALSYRPLVFVGTFAYSVYLLHAPLLQLFWQAFPVSLQHRPLPMIALLGTFGTAGVVGVSWAFFQVCERPFLNKKKPTRPESVVAETVLQPAP